jgi:hypothetical protein
MLAAQLAASEISCPACRLKLFGSASLKLAVCLLLLEN